MQTSKLPNPWQKTPLIFSDSLSAKLGCDVYLKLEHLHPSYSFKQRSVGLLAREEVKKRGRTVHLVIASGGNAALSAAHAAQQLGVTCEVFIPIPSCKPSMIEALKRFGAIPNGVGETYAEALEKAEEFVAKTPNAALLQPYNHPTLWQGASTLVEEIAEQLPKEAPPPTALVCSIGGGSLLGGLLIGCERNVWNATRIVAIETTGSDSMFYSVLASENPALTVPPRVKIVGNEEHGVQMATLVPTSRATSLGASWSAPAVIKRVCSRRAIDRTLVTLVNIPDELAMNGALQFADEHKTLIELAGGATLAPAYSPLLFKKLFGECDEQTTPRSTIVFIVCGGFKVTLKDMAEYRAHWEACQEQNFDSWIDDEQINIAVE